MKPILLLLLLTVGFGSASAQKNLKEILPGKWKLVRLIGKTTSENEKKKQYIFSEDGSMAYISVRGTMNGTYTLAPEAREITLVFPDKTVVLKVVKYNGKTMTIREGAKGSVMAVIEKIPE